MVFSELSFIITLIFLIVILSYYVLLFWKPRKPEYEKELHSISIIIPAHNEERHIAQAIRSVQEATFTGDKEIIVVDDGSADETARIARESGVSVLVQKHTGKAASINRALEQATGEIIAIVDADSEVESDALEEMADVLMRKGIGGATGIVKVKNRFRLICMWFHIEQLYNSLMRSLWSKMHANIVTPGPLSMYRREALDKIGGFGTEGYSEDIDVTIRLIREGYQIGFAEKSVALTNMPHTPKEVLRQRMRFARGMANILKRHLRVNTAIIDLYTLPLFLFYYVQAVILGSFTIYQIVSGYTTYFLAKGVVLNMAVGKFFFEWFSIWGFVRWAGSVATGQVPLDFVTFVGIIATLLSYPLFFYAIWKFDRKLDIYHVIPLLFMFPFWLLIMVIHVLALPAYLHRSQPNIWLKNE